MPIVYSCVARGPVILCSHQAGYGNFGDNAAQMLPNIPTRNDAKTTYTSNNYMYHVIVENGIIYMCASDADFGRRQPYAFLTEVKRQLMSGSLGHQVQFAGESDLNHEFSPVLANQMERFSRPGGGDQISTLQAQVQEVTGVMTQNIEKVLERGERLDDLMDKTTDLESHSQSFKKSARRVHRKMWFKNMKMNICIACTVFIVLAVIIIIILFSTHVLPPNNNPTKTTLKPVTPTPATR